MHAKKLAFIATVLFVHLTLMTAPVHAVNQARFCANLITSYADTVGGQDVLISSTEKTNNHWAVVETGGGTHV